MKNYNYYYILINDLKKIFLLKIFYKNILQILYIWKLYENFFKYYNTFNI